jgi:imidazolonepropionase-like amidohydrolase
MHLHVRGVLLPDRVQRDLFVVDGRFTFDPVADARTVLDGGYLVPGLVDAHAHLELASPAPPGASPREAAVASAQAQLAAGVLALREPGGPARASTGIGPADGLPRTFTAGRALASPGGYAPGIAREVTDEELPDAAEQEARTSGAWAKVIGDTLVSGRANFSAQALAEATRRVHAVGARIAVHVVGLRAVAEAAIEAGVDSIEHGMPLGSDHLAAMAAAGIAWVPTLTVYADQEQVRQALTKLGVPPAGVAAVLASIDRQPALVAQAVGLGIRVLAGTDAGMGPHGRIRGEVGLLLAAGLTPQQALGAASWEARSFLGLPGIQQGAPADLVAFAADPLGDPEVLARPVLRMLAGRLLPEAMVASAG